MWFRTTQRINTNKDKIPSSDEQKKTKRKFPDDIRENGWIEIRLVDAQDATSSNISFYRCRKSFIDESSRRVRASIVRSKISFLPMLCALSPSLCKTSSVSMTLHAWLPRHWTSSMHRWSSLVRSSVYSTHRYRLGWCKTSHFILSFRSKTFETTVCLLFTLPTNEANSACFGMQKKRR